MRIGIDTHAITKSYATGSSTYVAELVRALVAVDHQNEYFLYAERNDPFYQEFVNNHRVKVRCVLPTNPIIRDFVTVPRAIAQDSIDVAHVHFILPPFICSASVLTVFDLYYVHLRRSTLSIKSHGLLTAWSIRRAKSIITISEYSKRDIANTFAIGPAKIFVTPLGIGHCFSPVDDQKVHAVIHRIGIRQEYILFVGRTEDPRKNLMTLIEAYAILKSQFNTAAQLVIVGRLGAGTKPILQRVSELRLDRDVIMPGIIASEDLPALLSGAKVFVYASSFEGFGLPVLEAMACGTPVITSNAASLPEVAGKAALLVSPGKVGELVETLLLVWRDETLRHDMREQGLRRARLFSWERTARETLAVYDRAVKLRRRITFDQQR